METIRVVLAEDHALMREGTRRILEQQPDLTVVGEAGDGQEALDQIQLLQPDIAILDIRMPRLSGIEVVRRMQDCAPRTKALMLTAYDDDEYILALMELGADGYLLETSRSSELVEAVRSIHAGEPVLHPAIAVKLARLWRGYRATPRHDAGNQLSAREQEVLGYAAQGLRNKAIADRLVLSVRTVEGHINSILTKLGVASRTEAVLYAVAHGWVSGDEKKRDEANEKR